MAWPCCSRARRRRYLPSPARQVCASLATCSQCMRTGCCRRRSEVRLRKTARCGRGWSHGCCLLWCFPWECWFPSSPLQLLGWTCCTRPPLQHVADAQPRARLRPATRRVLVAHLLDLHISHVSHVTSHMPKGSGGRTDSMRHRPHLAFGSPPRESAHNQSCSDTELSDTRSAGFGIHKQYGASAVSIATTYSYTFVYMRRYTQRRTVNAARDETPLVSKYSCAINIE